MPDQTEPLDLDAVRRVANAATPPPWEIQDGTSETDVPVWAGGDYLCCSPDDGVRGGHSRADAEFIAAARQWVPELVAEVDLWAWSAGCARGALARVVGLIPTGPLRNQVAEIVAELDRELFPDAVGTEQREGSDA